MEKRKPYRAAINGRRNKLSVKGGDPNYVYRIVNDVDDRVNDLKERGYEFETNNVQVGDKRVATPKQEGSPVKMSVGGGIQAYLMKIKKEWYEEDQLAKNQIVNETEEAIRANPTQDGNYGKVDILFGK